MANRVSCILFGLLVCGSALSVTGCGGGKGLNENLLTLQTGQKWVYSISGTATLPSGQGGGTQNLQTTSKLTMEVASTTARDLNNELVSALDRKLDVFLLDGREITGNFRLYFTQTSLGVFAHGVNVYNGTTLNAANDVFVPSTATPAFKFLYLPNPLADGSSLSYSNPLKLTTSSDVSYNLQVGSNRQSVSTPAGDFFAKPISITEKFSRSFAVTNAGIVPESGLIVGNLDATLPDGTRITGLMTLTQVTF